MKIKILKDIKIIHTSWKGIVKEFSFQEGQIIDNIGLISDIFDSELFVITWNKGSFELNKNLFKKIS